MNTINAQAHARIGLLGNPSDLYGGRGIGFSFDAFTAEVELEASDALGFEGEAAPLLRAGWEVFRDAALDVSEPMTGREPVAGDALRLLDRPFVARARSDIPRQAGLAGSSALLTALLRALARWHGLALPPHRLAWLAWRAESEVMGIRAGPMDRLAQAFGGLVSMDFARPWAPDATRRLDPALLPPLVLAWEREPGEASGAVHADVFERWQAGDPALREAVAGWAPLVARGEAALGAGDREQLIACVNANFDLRARLFPIGEGDRRMIELGRGLGAGTKFCGSGGAVLAVARDEAQRDELLAAYDAAGFGALAPRVCGPAPAPAGALRAVVLAAGFATRLYPLTRTRAKPLLDVGGAPMLTHLVRQLQATGAVADVTVIANGLFADDVRAWAAGLHDTLHDALPVHVIDNGVREASALRGAVADLALALERAPAAPATAGATQGWLVAAGDNLLDQPLDGLLSRALAAGRPRLLVRRLPQPVPPRSFSEVQMDGRGRVRAFREKPDDPQSPLSALALYCLPADLPARVEAYLARPGAEADAPGHLLAWLCAEGECDAEIVGGRWFDIGDARQLAEARAWATGREG